MTNWDEENVASPHQGPKLRILLVDDEVDFTRLLRANLEITGVYEVQMENNPVRVLEAARAFKPDLVVLDFLMPGMDGGEVAAQLRGDSVLKNTPVLFLTAAVSSRDVDSWVNKISGPCLAKPITPEDLIAWIELHLKR